MVHPSRLLTLGSYNCGKSKVSTCPRSQGYATRGHEIAEMQAQRLDLHKQLLRDQKLCGRVQRPNKTSCDTEVLRRTQVDAQEAEGPSAGGKRDLRGQLWILPLHRPPYRKTSPVTADVDSPLCPDALLSKLRGGRNSGRAELTWNRFDEETWTNMIFQTHFTAECGNTFLQSHTWEIEAGGQEVQDQPGLRKSRISKLTK